MHIVRWSLLEDIHGVALDVTNSFVKNEKRELEFKSSIPGSFLNSAQSVNHSVK